MDGMGAMVVMAVVVVAAAAIRSTWSPCGLSMLSTVTPLAEAARGNRYRTTATWFWIGAVVGGATLGLGAAALAALVSTVDLSTSTALAAGALAAVLALGIDLGVLGRPIPHHRRQVNEDWLPKYRSWVYGSGFGWQIGTGLATYIMTAAVYLVIALAALTGSPLTAFGLCVLFGALRGSAVLLGAGLTSDAALRSFHRRFDALREPVRRMVMVVEVLTALGCAIVAGTTGGALAAIGALVVLAAIGVRRIRAASSDRELALQHS
jgi:hypothetical protein